jgi:predicted permease
MQSLETLWQDARYALRMMRRSPGFTAVAVVSLALGSGANTAVFSVVNALMLRELPVRNPSQLVEVLSTLPGDPRMNHFWWKFYEQYRDRNHVFSELIAMSPSRFRVGDGQDVELVPGEYVVGTFFQALGLQPSLGRLIGPEDDRLGTGDPAVAVISWYYVFGLAPVWNAFAVPPSPALRETGAVGETRSRRVFGRTLVVAQVALAVILLSTAGLFVNHLSTLRHHNLGFERDSVLLVTLDPTHSGYTRDRLSRSYQDLLARLEAIPGVRSAALSAITPIEGGAASRFVSVEAFHENPQARRRISLNWVGPKYFQTLGTAQLAGRDFTSDDENGPAVAIVNQAFTQYYFGDSSPVGKRFRFEGQEPAYEIVGLVADAKYSSLHERAPRTIYLHAFQEARGRFSQFAVRTTVAPSAVAGEVRRAMREVVTTVPISKITTLAEQVDGSTRPERLIAVLSSLFGGLGAMLTAVGLYGLLAYTVARRTSEIGVRIALGATRRYVTLMVLRGALGLVGAGLVAGAPLAVLARRFATRLTQDQPVASAVPIVVAVVAMIAVALLAACLPARRAASVDPIEALRRE